MDIRTIVRIERPSLGTNSPKDLEDIVDALQPIEVNRHTGDADFLLGELVVIAHELDEAQFFVAPDVAAEAGDGLFVGV